MSEIKLLERLKDGDRKAIKEAYEVIFHYIIKFILKNNGTVTDAKAITGQTLLVILKNIKKVDFELSASFKTYAYSIANKKWMMELRDRKKHAPHSPRGDGKMDDLPYQEEDFFQKEEAKEQQKWIAKQLDYLTPKCKKILILFYYKEEAFEAIAPKVELSTESVKVTKHRCLETLRQRLKNKKP